MEESRQDTSSYNKLKEYLISTHGSKMSNFQHLSRAWDLQRGEDEKLTDFAGRLETTLSEAAVHIKANYKAHHGNGEMSTDAFIAIMGAMLMSEKIKSWTPAIYPHLVPTMDRHYSASGIAGEAQCFIDRGVRKDYDDDTSDAMYGRDHRWPHHHQQQQQQHVSRNRPTVQQNKAQNRYHNRDGNTIRHREICHNYSRGRRCYKGRNCPFRHPPPDQAHIAIVGNGDGHPDNTHDHNDDNVTRQFGQLDFQ